MVDAPERIWAYHNGNSQTYLTSPNKFHNVEYVRADLYEQVKRDNADLKDLLDDARSGAAKLLADRIRSEAAERLAGARIDTGCRDRNGEPIYLGDKVRYNLEGSHTKQEYWNPEYEVIFVPPSFTLKHVGGGKDGGSHDFKLRCGGGNGDLEIIERGPYHATPPASAIREALPATGPYVDRLIRVFRDRPADDTSAVVLQDYARAALAGAKP